VLLATMLVPLVGEGAVESMNGDTKAVSAAVFGTWVWPFELLSVLLLAALIGAFALAKIAGAGLVRVPRRRRRAPSPRPPAAAATPAPPPEPEPPTPAAAEAATVPSREGNAS
jgi:hypothetical protein